ncbi:hypothetical protein J6590_084861 [Homalodisca vitripennis]|nr:hypothetical protein J6590_084861 [Homalodisca vitripennis]
MLPYGAELGCSMMTIRKSPSRQNCDDGRLEVLSTASRRSIPVPPFCSASTQLIAELSNRAPLVTESVQSGPDFLDVQIHAGHVAGIRGRDDVGHWGLLECGELQSVNCDR